MKIKLTLLMLLTASFAFSQWRYESGGNQFDGKYKTCHVIGKGGSWPFNKPALMVNYFENGSMNVYLGNIGYTGCRDNNIKVSFGDDRIYHTYDVSTDSDSKALFINSFKGMSKYEFIDKLRTGSKVYIRYANSCGQEDYEFSLSGSTKALNFVLKEWLAEEEAYLKELEAEIDPIIEYFKNLGCDDLLDTTRIMYTQYLEIDKNIFKTEEGQNAVEKGSLIQYFNSNRSVNNFKVKVKKGERDIQFHIDAETARYICDWDEAIDEMDKGMKQFRAFADNCE